MEYKTEFTIALPEELLNVLGIDEDSMFEAYFDDGKIKVRLLEEDAVEVLEDDDDEEDDDLDIPEKCVMCPNFCWNCRTCTIDI